MQAEALEEQSAWCRRFAQINAVGLRKARIPFNSKRHITASISCQPGQRARLSRADERAGAVVLSLCACTVAVSSSRRQTEPDCGAAPSRG